MRFSMRQSRDGAIEIIDVTPRRDEGFAALWKQRPSWTNALRWMMRTLAWVWVAKGLFNWGLLLGLLTRYGDFLMLPRGLQAPIVIFAAADLFAAIGLWLAAPWGGALWVLCALGETLAPFFGGRGGLNTKSVLLNLALVVVYFVLNWRAGQERD